MNEQKLSEWLKLQREQKSISLEDVLKNTRISKQYLQAIEQGRWEEFPAEVYRRGFLKDYAEFLKLDVEQVLQRYQQETQSVNLETTNSLEADVASERVKIFQKSIRNFRALILFALFLVVVGFYWKLDDNFPLKKLKSNVLVVTSVASNTVQKRIENVVPDQQAELTQSQENLNFRVNAKKQVWVRVISDKKLTFSGFLSSASQKSWTAKKQILVRIGNYEAVSMTLNGHSVQVEPRKESAVVELLLTPQTLTQLNSQKNVMLKHYQTK